jgi:hypothetical protein
MSSLIFIVPLLILIISIALVRKISISLWKESKANEWLLIIRNGKLIKSGIGLCTFV